MRANYPVTGWVRRDRLITELGFPVGFQVGFRVGFRVGFSSWIFELDFRVVLHIVSRSFQDGGERGLQIVKGNLV